jgi:adaptin ear-binding coat-associated protein 1/2
MDQSSQNESAAPVPAQQQQQQEEVQQQPQGSLLRQTLMTQDECFVYKVPPLATASGYRANDWNLANPLQTCGFQVERRDNDLYLLFTLERHTKLFALSRIYVDQRDNNATSATTTAIQRSVVEPVLDSSRYFVCKIQQQQQHQTGKTAILGFGFRDRDVAMDLLGNLQQFQHSIEREIHAKHLKVREIPTLQEGEQMHIHLPGGMGKTPSRKNTVTNTKTTSSSSSSLSSNMGGGGAFLLKKPPPSAGSTPAPPLPSTTTTTLTKVEVVNLAEMETPPEPMDLDEEDQGAMVLQDEDAEDEDSEGAVAKSIIYDFDDIEDDGLEETTAAVGETPSTTTTATMNDDDDFGDFQGA